MVKDSKSDAKETTFIERVQKRDGSIVPFDFSRVVNAIHKAMVSVEEGSEEEAKLVSTKVLADLVRIVKKFKNFVPTVEGIQDTVEKELILSEYVKTAKSYILYRDKRSKLREKGDQVPEKVRKLTEESKKYFKRPVDEFV